MGQPYPDDLGGFLSHRRSLLQPADIGLPTSGRRRVPGLRREELAIAAGVSPDHYQRIEQGRVHPSTQVLDALAGTLRLDSVETEHLHNLARAATKPTSFSPSARADQDRLHHLVDSFIGAAFVINYRRDILAWNSAAANLVYDFATLPPTDRNMAWLILTHPAMKELYADWASAAQEQVALLRRAVGAHPRDQDLAHLLQRLRATSPDFDTLWQQHNVQQKTAGTKKLNRAGSPLHLHYQALKFTDDPNLELFLYLPGQPS